MDEAQLLAYIVAYIDTHRVVVLGPDAEGRMLFRRVQPYCPACFGEDHEQGQCPEAAGSEGHG